MKTAWEIDKGAGTVLLALVGVHVIILVWPLLLPFILSSE